MSLLFRIVLSCMIASILARGWGADGCSSKAYPRKYRRPQPDAIYHYAQRQNHSVFKNTALPGEVCNFDHRKLERKSPPTSVDYLDFDAGTTTTNTNTIS
jgi:hypothetical protein